jgi:hypothetical protein
MNDHELVNRCLQEICDRSGFESSHKLTQRDLEFLCDDIEEKTSILISLSTMKRLLNGQFSRLPQVATLNAISSYLGYTNWQDFKIQQKKEEPVVNGHGYVVNGHEHAVNGNMPVRKKRISYKIIGIAAAVLLIAVIVIAFTDFSKTRSNDYSTAVFSVQKTTSNEIPNTAVFHYNIDDLEGDSFFIQQSWDKNRRVRIYKKNYTLTDIYYEPGYHNAKLIVNDSIIKTFPVSIPSNRWIFYAKEETFSNHPKYIRGPETIENGILSIKKDRLPSYDVDYQKEQLYVCSFFPSTFTTPSDNFTYSAKVRLNNVRNATCPFIMCEIFCQYYFMYFITAPPGCTSVISEQFGDLQLNGKINDLASFGSNVTEWQKLQMVVKDRKVHIYINQKEIYNGVYTQSSGLITGLGFISNGLCEVDEVSLKGLDGKVVYENDFGAGGPLHP